MPALFNHFVIFDRPFSDRMTICSPITPGHDFDTSLSVNTRPLIVTLELFLCTKPHGELVLVNKAIEEMIKSGDTTKLAEDVFEISSKTPRSGNEGICCLLEDEIESFDKIFRNQRSDHIFQGYVNSVLISYFRMTIMTTTITTIIITTTEMKM